MLKKQNKNLKNHLSKAFKIKVGSSLARILSTLYDFSIDEETVQVISSNDFESYTFIVNRDTINDNLVENYVYTAFNDGSYTQMLVSYPIIEINQGNIVFDMSNATAT